MNYTFVTPTFFGLFYFSRKQTLTPYAQHWMSSGILPPEFAACEVLTAEEIGQILGGN